MRSLNVGVCGELYEYADAMVHRLRRLGFGAGMIDAPERQSADVVVFISCEDRPDGLKNLSAYSYGYNRYGHGRRVEAAVTPVVLVRYGLAFYLRGSLAGD